MLTLLYRSSPYSEYSKNCSHKDVEVPASGSCLSVHSPHLSLPSQRSKSYDRTRLNSILIFKYMNGKICIFNTCIYIKYRSSVAEYST
jgi:hypothetical protein